MNHRVGWVVAFGLVAGFAGGGVFAGGVNPKLIQAETKAQQQVDFLHQRERDLPNELAEIMAHVAALGGRAGAPPQPTNADPAEAPVAPVAPPQPIDAPARIAELNKQIAKLQLDIKNAPKGVTTAQAQYDALRKKAMPELEGRDDYKNALAQAEAAKKALDAATAECLKKLALANPNYAKAKKAAETNDALVQKLRPAGPSEELTAASSAWMDALSQTKNFETKALDADAGVKATRADDAEKQAAVATIREAFNKEIADREDIKDALTKLDDAKKLADTAKADLKQAQADLQGAQRLVTLHGINNPQQLNAQLAALKNEETGLKGAIQAAEQALEAAHAAVEAAQVVPAPLPAPTAN